MSIFVIIDGQKTLSTPAHIKELAYVGTVGPATLVEIDGATYPAAAIRPLAEYFLAVSKLVEFPVDLTGSDEPLKCVFVDTETPNGRHDSICSIGFVTEDGETFESLVYTDEEFNPYAIKMHGITASDVLRAPKFPEIWEPIASLFVDNVIVGYNTSVDIRAIQYMLRKHGIAPPTLYYIDVLTMAQEALQLPKYDLEEVCAALGIAFNNHHNALADAIACRDVFEELTKRGVFYDVEKAQFDEISFATSFYQDKPAKPTNAQNAEKLAFSGILKALQEYGSESARKTLERWIERNSADHSETMQRYRHAAEALVSEEYSEQVLNAAQNVARDVSEKPTLAAFVYYLDAVGDDRTCNTLQRILDELNALEPKESPGNAKQLKKLLKDAIASPDALQALETEIHRALRPFDFALTDASQISFIGKSFTLSGGFERGKEHLEMLLEKKGAEIHDPPKMTTDYLIIGEPDPAWKLGTHGGTKIIKAVGFQAKGTPIQLVFEATLLEALEQAVNKDAD